MQKVAKPKLLIAPIDYKGAKFACENFHYSKTIPAGKAFMLGVWENDKYIGCVVYSRGANCHMSKYFGLPTNQISELSRVALREHKTAVSKILSISLKLLRKHCPDLKLIFSYSDITNQGHQGGIYRADNWTLLNKSVSKSGHVKFAGKIVHYRSINAKFKSKKNIPPELLAQFEKLPPQEKYLFVKLLDKNLNISALSKESVASSSQLLEAGAKPSSALQSKEANNANA